MAFDGVDLVDVVRVDYRAGEEAAQELCYEVNWEAPPWELSEDAVRECDGGVEIRFGAVSHLRLWRYGT